MTSVKWVDIRKCIVKNNGDLDTSNAKIFESLEAMKEEYSIEYDTIPYFAEPIIRKQ